MNSVSIAASARSNLREIFRYGLTMSGLRQARRYANRLDHIFQLLAENPRMGRPADSIAVGIRRHEHGAHVILYEETDAGVTILAIIHSASLRGLRL